MKEIRSPIKAIRAKCLDCSLGSAPEVRLCEIESCPLWPFRMGKNPHSRRKGNPKALKALAEARKKKTKTKKEK